jgi:adenylate kinase
VRVVVLGRQGAGKGTQSTLLARRFGVTRVSTGDVFRAAVKAGSDLGRQVGAFIDAGELVPDDLAVAVVAERLAHETAFVLDGFPRTVPQVQQFDALLAPARIDAAIDIRIDPDVALTRLLSRRVCGDCGHIEAVVPNAHGLARCSCCAGALTRRPDDTESVIRRRLALYEELTRPLLSWFAAAGMLRTVDGQGPVDVVARRVERAISRETADDEAHWSLARLSRGLEPA